VSSKQILKVAVPVPLRQLFDYLPPAGGDMPLPGCRCEVDFAGRRLVGLVWAHGPAETGQKLKPVRRVIDAEPVLDADLRGLCQRAADYYHHPIGETLHTALPVLLRQGEQAEWRGELVWRLTPRGRHADPAGLSRAPRQQQALETLAEHPQGLTGAMLSALGVQRQPLKALEKKGWTELVSQGPPEEEQPASLLRETPLTAEPEQAAAVQALKQAEGFVPFLLDGVTGSGKTEVYLQAMEAILHRGRQVLVLVPEIGLTPQTIHRFRQRFAVPVTVLHSGLTDRERLQAWIEARDGHARVILGTRSAIFTPLQKPGLIIVDEAHDGSFKQQDGLRYSARDLATWRARLLDVPVVLGTATPSLETLHLAEQGRYRPLRLTQRAGGARPPQLALEDCRQLSPATPISPNNLAALEDCLKAGHQALVFLNRRGYAPMLLCGDCGWQAECRRCDSFLTWHKHARQLRCHHCGHQQRVPTNCPDCGSTALTDTGAGTEKLEEYLNRELGDWPVLRIDRDSTRRKGSLDRQLERVAEGKPAILVGTQMLAKGHHFGRLALAVILDADAGFLSADFRGPEQAAQLILQVAGRTGRADIPGQVRIQTRHPELALLQQLVSGDYHRIAEILMAERRGAGLPPYGHMALIRAEAMQPGHGMNLLGNAASLTPDPDVQMLGPVPAPMERRAGRYRQQLMLLAPHRRPLHRTLSRLLTALEQDPLARRCRWHLDVDPLDML
jgi:primosomal protein N' (replication factor Y)